MFRAASIALACALVTGVPGTAHAVLMKFGATLDGAGGTPPNASTATGDVKVWWNTSTHLMRIKSTFSGFATGSTNSHIHCCTATPFVRNAAEELANPPAAAGASQWAPFFPLGVTSGIFDHTFDMSLDASWSTGFRTANGGALGAEAALLSAMTAGRTIYNVHTVDWPSGEIGAFLRVQAVPEPASIGIFGLGLALMGLRRARRQKVL